MKNETTLYEYNDFYTGERNPISLYLAKVGRDIKLNKFGGGLHQSVRSVLEMIERESDLAIRYLGRTSRRDSVYEIEGELYKVYEGWHCNNETRAYLEPLRCKYIWMFDGYDYVKVVTESIRKGEK